MNTNVIHGPRGLQFFLTARVQCRWASRVHESRQELLHAVRFSRVIATTANQQHLMLWYEPHLALFLCSRTGTTYNVVTVYDAVTLELYVRAKRTSKRYRDIFLTLEFYLEKQRARRVSA